MYLMFLKRVHFKAFNHVCENCGAEWMSAKEDEDCPSCGAENTQSWQSK